MYDFFRDNLGSISNNSIIGGYDIHNKCYTLSLHSTTVGRVPVTLSFDEQIKGWTSRYSYGTRNLIVNGNFIGYELTTNMFSIRNNFYSTTGGGIFQHYSENVNRANFYGTQYNSQVQTILNLRPSLIKTFQTINYEGASNWSMDSFVTNEDTANAISVFVMPTTLAEMENNFLKNQFKQKEDKYFANLVNTSVFAQGEVVFGKSISGVKGFFATVTMSATNTGDSGTNELFAVSSNFIESSY